MASHPVRGEDHFLAMTVRNIGFLLDRLGEDCHPLQFLRELTQNAVEAIGRSGKSGEIIWDLDWNTFELEGTRKLSVIDTGDGMTGEEMVRFINQLSSSVSEQSFSGNYGVGAKIAAATRNPFGVLYLSWKHGQGSMIQLYRDGSTGQYGLKQWRHADGAYEHYLPLEDDVKPDVITDHGTMVVLLGAAEEDDTMRAPAGAASPSRWVSKYLNTRYFRLPESVSVKAREGWEYPRTDKNRNVLRKVTGQRAYLEQHKHTSGIKQLSDATCHWWILKDEAALTNNSGFVESSGHMAALYQDELYELATARSGVAKLQQFGITFGHRFVVIYVEPHLDSTGSVTTNTSRTALLVDKEPLPWADWSAEFRDNMPEELAAFVSAKAAAAADTDHTKAIRDRLKDILEMFKLSRYQPAKSGSRLVDPDTLVRGGKAGSQSRESGSGRSSTSRSGGGTGGNIYAVFEKKDGVPGKVTRPDPFPTVRWVTVIDGTRETGDIEDRAAKYLPEQNLLLINADFRVFHDVIEFFSKEFSSAAAAEEVARDAVRAWFEQALVETVIGIQALRSSKVWSSSDIDAALSEEGLTASAMQRYHVHFAVKRELGSKLGGRKARGESAA
jgi:hypothetical protein